MMALERMQLLLDPQQRKKLKKIAKEKGKSVSDVTRQAIELGISILIQEDEFTRRQAALERADKFRQSMPLLDIDVVEDIRQMREERDAQISGRN